MKKLILLIIIILSATFTYAQSTNWKQINTPHKKSVKLIYQASDGTLFGHIEEKYRMVTSIDNGENWIYIQNENIGSYIYYNIPFKESRGKIYYVEEYTIYIFDKVNLKFDTFITIDDYNPITDFDILYNGDIVIGTTAYLFLYSETGILQNLNSWTNQPIKFLVAPNDIGKNYITNTFGNADDLWEFSPNLNLVGDKKSIGSRLLVRLSDRLITENKYSDDGGISWNYIQGFSNEFIRVINVAHDNKIYFLSWDGIYISNDGGRTVEFKNFTALNTTYVSSTNNIIIFDSEDNNSCDPEIYISTDLGTNLQKIKNNIGGYIVEKIFPGIAENLFVKSCYVIHQSKSAPVVWKGVKLINQSGINEVCNDIFHLSNNDIIASFGSDQIYKSFNGGESWNEIKYNLNFSSINHFFTEKNGVIYQFDYDSLAISEDFGNSWHKKEFAPNIVFRFSDKVDFSQNEDIYFYDELEFSNIVKYNAENQVLTPINFTQENRPLLDFGTSFDGNQLLILSKDWNNEEMKIHVSYNGGQTFQEHNIGLKYEDVDYHLKTDHLGNIYVYSESKVLISYDQGNSWENITPYFPEPYTINDLQVSYDNYIYLATNGKGILKYILQLLDPKTLKVSLYDDINKNCQKVANEGSINQGKIVLNNNYVKAVDNNGEATFYVYKDQNTVSVQFNEKIYEYCQASYDVDISTGIDSISIPLKTKKYCADLITSISTPFL